MKKITLALGLFVGLALNAQIYYQLPAAAGNPNGYNTPADAEQPVVTGSTPILASSASPAWSPVQTIPFSFQFNGITESSFKVSSTGVLTFETTATAVPTSTPAPLPSASIPDKSIMVWGIQGTGANDAIATKVYGTAPNRQLWVMFLSFSVRNATATQNWAYNSIVLEEGSNAIYLVDQRILAGGGTDGCTYGIQVDGTTGYQVAGSPNQAHSCGDIPDETDNIHYAFLPGPQPAYDLSGTSVVLDDVELLSSAPFSIKAKFFNLGTSTISGLTLNYKVNGGAVVSSALTGLSVPSFQASANLTHPTAWTPAASGQYKIKVWASALNGSNPDEKHANDTITKTILVVTNSPARMVVIEEKTGTWCGWCPRGAVGMDYMSDTYPATTATIAVHNADPMVVAAYDGSIGLVAPGGYPGSAVDRVLGPDPNSADLTTAYNERIGVKTFVEVLTPEFVSYDWSTRVLKMKVKTKFTATLTGGFNMILVLTEDNVKGTSSGYAQVNYYSSSSQNIPLTGAGHNWQQSPNPVPAADMTYDHVARAIVGGFEGNATAIPNNVVAGTMYEYTFSYTLKGTESILDFTAVGIVTNRNTYEILNANKVALNSVIGIEEGNIVNALNNIKVYPNPAVDVAYVSVDMENSATANISIINTLGQVVYASTENLEVGENKIELNTSNLASGVYVVQMEIDGHISSAKINIQ